MPCFLNINDNFLIQAIVTSSLMSVGALIFKSKPLKRASIISDNKQIEIKNLKESLI
jgi:hypothetical protein